MDTRLSLPEKLALNKDKLILAVIDNLKRDIEGLHPRDGKAEIMINELLYHFAWKLSESENSNG